MIADLDTLIDRARAGEATRGELDAVAQRLLAGDPPPDAHRLLCVLTFAREPRYRTAVERYLDCRQDLELARAALGTLCTYWQLTGEYVDWLLWYGNGVHWDLDYRPVVRPLALMLAGRHLARARCRALLELLVRVASDGTELPYTVADAGLGLLLASGVPDRLAPLDVPADDPRFGPALAAARERLRSEPAVRASRTSVARRPPAARDVPEELLLLLPDERTWPEVVHRARAGHLSETRLDAIATAQPDRLGPERAMEHLLVLLFAGRPHSVRHRRSVERYLRLADQPEAARLALIVLCAGWGLTATHLPDLACFLRGVAWDRRGQASVVRPAAFAIAGAYLARRRSRPLLELLVTIAEDEAEEETARSAAALALHVSYGGPSHLLPDEVVPGDDPFAWALMMARERLATE